MDQDIRRKLNQITDTLWAGGVTNPVTYIEQLSYLIYLKLLDEEESSRELQSRLGGASKLLFYKQAERHRWSNGGLRVVPTCATFCAMRCFPTWRLW